MYAHMNHNGLKRKLVGAVAGLAAVIAVTLAVALVTAPSSTSVTEKEFPSVPIYWPVEDDRPAGQGRYETLFSDDVVLAIVDEKRITASTWAIVQITAGTSWAQVDEVLYCGQNDSGYDGYSLTVMGTYCANMKFPTTATKIDINGIIEITSDNTAGFTDEDLRAAGFNVLGSKESWAASKSYNTSTTFKVMS